MKYTIGAIVVIGVVVLLSMDWGVQPRAATTAWIPIVAKQTGKTIQRSPQGTAKVVHETTGIYLRDSMGSIYIRGISVEGGAPSEVGLAVLSDTQTGAVYHINFQDKRVTGVKHDEASLARLRQPMDDRIFHQFNPPERFLGTRDVSGIACDDYSVPSVNSTRPPSTLCFAPSLNYLILESRFVEPNANTELIVTLHDIEVGREPDPKLMTIPEGFDLIWDMK